MTLVRYEPWNVMSQLQREMQRAFSNAIDTDPDSNSSSATADWSPAVDITEYQDQFELLIDLPGVEATSVEISLDNDVLTLSGERPVESGWATIS
jgi:HSP20 family protein